MKLRALVMKEAKVGKSMELEGFMKRYPERDGWEVRLEVEETTPHQFDIKIIVQTKEEEAIARIRVEQSKVLKQHLQETGVLRDVYVAYVQRVANELANAAEILLK